MRAWLKKLFGKENKQRMASVVPGTQPPAYVAKAPPEPLAGEHLEQLKNIAEPMFQQSPMRNAELIADLRMGGYLEPSDPPRLTEKGKAEASESSPWPVDGKLD